MDAIEKLIISRVDQSGDRLIRFAEDIARHAEEGFCEYRTADQTAAFLENLGLSVERGLAITGVRAQIGQKRPALCILSELDGIRCPAHPLANPENGCSHACGHHMQLAGMLGAALALNAPEVRDILGGSVVFFAVPAEEHISCEKKAVLQSRFGIRTCCGKSELIYSGAFDNIDAALTTHAHMVPCKSDLLLGNNSSNGFLIKSARMLGRASHAAISPHQGINALDAVTLALSAIGMQRSTYRDEDHVRIHELLRSPCNAINVVPEEVALELQVRAKNWEAVVDASDKVNRALEAGAHAFGATVQIQDSQGYLPVLFSRPIPALTHAASLLEPDVTFEPADPLVHNPASTDVGDLCHIMPVVNFTVGGFSGALHSSGFTVTDQNKAYLLPAKMMALTVYQLLKDEARQARTLIQSAPAPFTRQEYRHYVKQFLSGSHPYC